MSGAVLALMGTKRMLAVGVLAAICGAPVALAGGPHGHGGGWGHGGGHGGHGGGWGHDHHGGSSWSVSIGFGTGYYGGSYIGGYYGYGRPYCAPVYCPPPVVYCPPPVYYPPVTYVAPAPVVYTVAQPAPVYVTSAAPRVVVQQPSQVIVTSTPTVQTTQPAAEQAPAVQTPPVQVQTTQISIEQARAAQARFDQIRANRRSAPQPLSTTVAAAPAAPAMAANIEPAIAGSSAPIIPAVSVSPTISTIDVTPSSLTMSAIREERGTVTIMVGGSNAGSGYATRLVQAADSTDANPVVVLRNSPSTANPLPLAGRVKTMVPFTASTSMKAGANSSTVGVKVGEQVYQVPIVDVPAAK